MTSLKITIQSRFLGVGQRHDCIWPSADRVHAGLSLEIGALHSTREKKSFFKLPIFKNWDVMLKYGFLAFLKLEDL